MTPPAPATGCPCTQLTPADFSWHDPSATGWACAIAAARGHTPAPASVDAPTAHRHACAWLLDLIGWADHGACLTASTPAAATRLALQTAQTTHPGTPWRFLLTEASQRQVGPALRALGVPPTACTLLPTHDDHSLRVDALHAALSAEVPATCVIATAGDPVTGAIDPLIEVAAACSRSTAWLHVEGSYGGPAVALLNEFVDMRPGLAAADSLTLAPHTWLYGPDNPGVALFPLTPAPTAECTHALAPWWALAEHLDRPGFQRLIARDIAVAQHLRDVVVADPRFTLVSAGLSAVSFRVDGGPGASDLDPTPFLPVEFADGPALSFLCVDPDLTTTDVDAALLRLRG